ncbi:membrane fusion protein use1 domain-containing protein [Hirsutella rhossiliensis]|uniref:Membrane fusion protein use1 domain-containing protein n=1 Tax=Hirsutella rhossiliensis TaxID=111463 RepID=A0A9P8SFL5_9HYPO|nr:membrane fusion protein use1 domain-containing protein [Hirsutella rhossiliensis]KAH0959136.1 membrane fusion protein use1 domain-containing protein [Hirsutella rhossiliensis]
MARVAHTHTADRTTEKSHDALFVQLSQLVSRLQQNVLHPTPERERRLRTSEYERARVEANLEYALSLLGRLEQDAARITVPARKLERQDALHATRETLETLLDRMEDLRQLALDEDQDSDEEDLLGDIVPTPSESAPSTSAESRQEDTARDAIPASPTPQLATILDPPATPAHLLENISPTTPVFPAQDPTQTTQSLRGRSSIQSQPSVSADVSHSTARAALFANRREPAAPQTSTATAEAILDQQRAEQDSLSGSILQMASALKASSQRFSSSLEVDKDVVSRAGEGIDKTERGMDAARGRMGALRKMTEGKGWWGRLMLYAWVYGLMVALLLIVFVLPKLRF